MRIKRNKSIKISDFMPLLQFSTLTGEIPVFITKPKNVSGLFLRIGLDKKEQATHCHDGGMYPFLNLTEFI